MQRWLLRTAIVYAVLLPLLLFYAGIFVFCRFDVAIAQRNDAGVLLGEMTGRDRSPAPHLQLISPSQSAADSAFDPLSDQVYFYLGTDPIQLQKGSVVYDIKTLEQVEPTPVFDLPIDLWPSEVRRTYDRIHAH